MPKMMDMNLSYCKNLEDISFIDNMPDFRNGWFRDTKVNLNTVKPYRAYAKSKKRAILN